MSDLKPSKPGFGRVAVAVVAIFGAIFVLSKVPPSRTSTSTETTTAAKSETYRLIHAIGNNENEAARGLSKAECDRRKQDLKVVATSLGTYNESTGYGSITCLPESSF